jgi:hypothetical protein
VKSKYISLAITSAFVFTILAVMPSATFAQEGELQVVDEVIAQINDDVITLSMLKRETKERIEALKNWISQTMLRARSIDECSKSPRSRGSTV